MKVLVGHVRYRHWGGEDRVFEDEVALLRAAGVDVATLEVPSVSASTLRPALAASIALSRGDHAYGRTLMRDAIAYHQPDVVHLHNIYPFLGVGAMREVRDAGIRVVRTYHNYRLSCIAGTHFYRTSVCESCAPGRLVRGIARGCYRGSRLESAVMAAACDAEWRSLVDAGLPDVAICPSTFARDKLVGYGMPEDRVVVKPNTSLAGEINGCAKRSGALFVGRLGSEKGILPLVDAWPSDAPTLTVIGDGPLSSLVRERAPETATVLGWTPADATRKYIAGARVLVVPSLAYEGDPLSVIEALAQGTPVVCFDHGSLSRIGREITPDCVVPTGDFRELAMAAERVVRMSSFEWATLSGRARAAFDRSHRTERSLATLLEVYSGLAASKSVRTLNQS
ncbi:MAG: glycosyltransferase family 4 protein [Coriobacteriia bacterium]